MMRFDIITLFPDFIDRAASVGVVGRARERGLLDVRCWNPRDHAEGRHRKVDERPFGGGPGMVMMVEPLQRTLAAIRDAAAVDGRPAARVVALAPSGARFTHARAVEYLERGQVILFAARYEGVDQRFVDAAVDEELSIGDFVLSGGELAAAVVIDAVGRLIDGALGNDASVVDESFSTNALDWPHYTRPERIGDAAVPDVLLSGDHQAIARWRRKQALGRTWRTRPDLLGAAALDPEDRRLLGEFIADAAKQALNARSTW